VDELGKAVVVVSHDINFAFCNSDDVVAMRDGKVIQQGSPEAMIRPDVLAKSTISISPWRRSAARESGSIAPSVDGGAAVSTWKNRKRRQTTDCQWDSGVAAEESGTSSQIIEELPGPRPMHCDALSQHEFREQKIRPRAKSLIRGNAQ